MQLGTAAATTLQMGVAYDRNFGRVKQMTYPTSLADGSDVSTYVYYDDLGNAVREGFAQDYNAGAPNTSAAIRAIKTTDARGLPLSIHLGEVSSGSSTTVDWKETNTFDSSGWLLGRCVNQSGICQSSMVPSTTSADPLNEAFRYDVYGNLLKHVHGGRWLNGQTTSAGVQNYTYDTLHRLTSYSRSGNGTNVTVAYKYDAIGGLLKKTDYSADSDTAYSYLPNTHKVQTVSLLGGGMASFDYDANGNVQQKIENGVQTAVQYDVGNLPRRMSRNGITSDFFEAPGGRYWQRLVSGGSTRDTLMLEKTYERELVGGAVTVERYYVAGQLLTVKPSAVRKLSYLHQDRLGSNVAISEKALTATGGLDSSAPALVEVRGFDAFGKALDGQWGSTNNGLLNVFDVGSVFHVGKRNQRGFTGHEHLDEFALIHMNGRAYDFNLGRFYGVDPFIQFPNNSQSLNPYGYLMNNPLAGTDPTGYTACTDVSAKTSGTGTCEHNGATISYSGEGNDLKLSGGAASEFVSAANNAMGTTGDIRVSFNGASNRQGVTQVSQTDGVKGGAASIRTPKTNSPQVRDNLNQIGNSGFEDPIRRITGKVAFIGAEGQELPEEEKAFYLNSNRAYYLKYGIEINLAESRPGRGVLPIRISNKSGRSQVEVLSSFLWSRPKVLGMTLYSQYCDECYKTGSRTFSHEFGHVLGLDDVYNEWKAPKTIRNFNYSLNFLGLEVRTAPMFGFNGNLMAGGDRDGMSGFLYEQQVEEIISNKRVNNGFTYSK